MSVFLLLLLFSFASGQTPIHLGMPLDILLRFSNFINDPNSEFWIVIYGDLNSWRFFSKPFESIDQAILFANEIGKRFVSIRQMGPALKLQLNVIK